MPILPRVEPTQVQVGVPRGPRENAFTQLGAGLGKVADVVDELQTAQKKQELQTFDANVWTQMDVKHKQLLSSAEQITDAGEYQKFIMKGTQDIHNELSGMAGGDPDKTAIVNKRYGESLRGITDNVGAGVVARRKSTTEGNISRLKDFTIDASMDETNPDVIKSHMADFHQNLMDAPYMKDEEKQKVWDSFKKDLPYQWLAHQATQDPVAFINRFDRGEFKGLADTTSLDKSLDLATKIADGRARRDAQVGKMESDDAERKFEKLAETKKLDVNELQDAAKLYGWDKNKVDGILKMQLGIKVANPYEKLLIEQAMSPTYQSSTYTIGQVQQSEKNLRDLAKAGNISTNTEDYTSAMGRLQGIRDKLSIRGDVQDARSTFDARREIQNLYGKYLPGKNSPRIIAEKNSHFDKIESMGIPERRKYVEDLRKEFERQAAEDQGPTISRERLRGQNVK